MSDTPIDSRDATGEQVGSPLRDAAVDPKPSDFLAPTNAGHADPHGPDVVSPELHGAQGVRPVKPGDVADAPKVQDPAESAHAAEAVDVALEEPKGNATKAEWVAYAESKGVEFDPNATRDEIRDAAKS